MAHGVFITKFAFGSDKMLHLGAGAVIAVVGLAVTHSFWWAVGLAATAGVLKEVSDYYHPATDTAELWDALFTTLGGVIIGLSFLLA